MINVRKGAVAGQTASHVSEDTQESQRLSIELQAVLRLLLERLGHDGDDPRNSLQKYSAKYLEDIRH